ncbi:hypothetical protein [Legionella bononiensis]|uniref:Uncharacterized protein n=1 Tax=Legionella bononiensis TaxID=2793102 RepID=A0ABS1WAB7_9GAMM|nr:hypothetical protein [Legionella bononiensis]MBL7480464.1 hypothetical protein [Legionella bononiensis]MBL7526301.1 hypothetical protein [Legionella bononiensis]MBL7563204.1 hypothetical protein [Legionella bononiensis]
MTDLDSRELSIIKAIQRNYQQQLHNQMLTHYGVYLEQSEYPEKIYSWIELIGDTRLLAEHYLDTLIHKQVPSTTASLTSEASGFWYYINKAKLLIPEQLRNFVSDLSFERSDYTLFNSVTAELFSVTLGNSITEVLYDYFKTQFSGNQEDTQKQFASTLDKQKELSELIKYECKQISVELIKLFHFREMLLLGKISRTAIEPDVRTEFIRRARLKDKSPDTINFAIELYFARELSKIFNNGFQSLYQVHDIEIQSELQSPFIKWINQLSESDKVRQAFTQEIQLKFMLISRDFLLEQMNQPGFLAKHALVFSLITGLIVATVLAVTVTLTLGAAFLWSIGSITSVGFLLASMGAYFLINNIDFITYKRNTENRNQIQHAITMINNEYLRLKKELIQSKETSSEDIENTRDFKHINQKFLYAFEGDKVARGSVSGWLREYASRYRHSKAVEIDLGHEYKDLIIQSKKQTEHLINSINKKKSNLLNHWIAGTQLYLSKTQHADVIKEFELIQKIKEQVLEVISCSHYTPPKLLDFYCAPVSKGGLGGNESDFDHIKRFAPINSNNNDNANPYNYLCSTALNLFKKYEPRYTSELIFLGDPEYRQMLGISRGDYGVSVTADNIDAYLNNSYAFLLSLCNKISPGLGLDPLQQSARVKDEFILYRMLLLKQLSTLSLAENKEVNTEIKLKIKRFIKNRFNQDTEVIFDDLANQRFLLNKEVQNSKTYKNSDQFIVTDLELENITQAITLDVAYNSYNFKLIDILDYYLDEFLQNPGVRPAKIFAYGSSEQELNPQGTKQFSKMISQYCENTSAFLHQSRTNKALTATRILDCYKYNVTLQVYKTQLRIIKCIKELNKPSDNTENTEQQMEFLLNTFGELHRFAERHCCKLKNNSSCNKLFDLILNHINNRGNSKEWIKHLDSNEALIYLMNTLPEQIQLSDHKSTAPSGFFNQQGSIKITTNDQLSIKYTM